VTLTPVAEQYGFKVRRVFDAPRERVWEEWTEPERLVFTVSDRPGDDYELVTVDLVDLGDGRTEMLFEQRGSMLPAQYERAKEGWGAFFDRIAERLAA
jgi:uncharacterized protein YndB with AHSA1/START domain